MDKPRLPTDGSLFLWFSCWSGFKSSETSDEGADEGDVFEWLTKHVFCDDRSSFFNSDSIHLMDPLLFENVCDNFPSNRKIDYWSDSIVWDMPRAEEDQSTLRGVGYDSFNYTIWNVSFPTYRLGDPETQRSLQRAFELKLLNSYIAQDSLVGCRVAVVGNEAAFWLSNRISQEEKDVVQTLGIIFLVIQTLVLILVPRVGKKLAQRESRRKQEERRSKQRPIDEMLIASKGFLDFDTSQRKVGENTVGDLEQTIL